MSFAVNPLLEPEDRKAKPEPFPGQLVVAPALGRFWRLFRISVWRAFEHDAFATAKASAYSSILTFFPALLVLGSVLATVRRGEVYLREVSYALGRILPAGATTALAYLKGAAHRPVGLLLMAGLPLTFATILVAFGSRIETRVLFHIDHELGPLVLLLWIAIRWIIAILTSIAVIALIYHNAVPRTQPWHSVIPGAALATAMWLGVTALFGWYLQRYADYSIIYGSDCEIMRFL